MTGERAARVKACPECGSPDVIGLVGADVECLTCGTTSMGHLRSRPEVAVRRKAAYLAEQAALSGRTEPAAPSSRK